MLLRIMLFLIPLSVLISFLVDKEAYVIIDFYFRILFKFMFHDIVLEKSV